MTNTPLETDKYSSPRKWCLTKSTPCKKIVVMDFKVEFFPIQSDKTITFLCLTVGVQVPLTLTQQWFGSTLEAATGGVL